MIEMSEEESIEKLFAVIHELWVSDNNKLKRLAVTLMRTIITESYPSS